MQVEVGQKVKGKITRITDFGAFVRMEDGLTGMIHISQVADTYVSNIQDVLTVGQELEPTVLSVDEKGRISLTLKSGKKNRRGEGAAPRSGGRPSMASPADPGAQPALFETAPNPTSFEEMLNRFKSTSEEKISDLRKFQNGGKSAHKHKK
ncbi:MAG: S1 RNA-binding domain-containing protein [Oscillospiraceae bacterium]|nr:S1 RNA-binding domain-containing protein [Oscillospiraceae bacterium]